MMHRERGAGSSSRAGRPPYRTAARGGTPRPVSRSADPGKINRVADAAPVQERKLSGDRSPAEVPLATDEEKDRAVQEALARIAPED